VYQRTDAIRKARCPTLKLFFLAFGPLQGNVVSGNGINQDAAGINLESNDRNNIIAGNEIGTNAADDAMLGNSVHGIFLGDGSSNNTIGGPTVNDRNVISGKASSPSPISPRRGRGGLHLRVRRNR